MILMPVTFAHFPGTLQELELLVCRKALIDWWVGGGITAPPLVGKDETMKTKIFCLRGMHCE
ncbi:MAG: hypothetical protein A4E70_01993 [Syntrophus sp. PtaU1.Bin005]|nr:MAG: hypothetical protein A4E70_01993 [Syntrophus sp. PtaU1.Bin005]